jgi:4,5-dihydroxyphthalate decarboxylase
MARDDSQVLMERASSLRKEYFPITLAIGDYDRTSSVIYGRVKPEGIALKVSDLHHSEFCVKPVYEQYDVAEMSLSWYAMARCRGEPVVALPIFPLRMPVFAYVLVRADSAYCEPKDLIGKRIGVPTYRYTINLWLRGIFCDHYGLAPEQATWVTCAQTEGASFVIPRGIKFTVAAGSTADSTVDQRKLACEELLDRGDVDAIFVTELPRSFVEGKSNFRRLFKDAQAETHSYVRRTGILPITHTLVMRESLSKGEPWISESLIKAFTEAQRQCDEFWLTDPKRMSMADMVFYIEKNYAAYGANAWAQGLAPNRHVIDTFMRYAHEQGYTSRRLSVDEAFPELCNAER